MQFHHHARVAPFRSAVGRTHAVYHQLVGACGGRNDKTSGTHAERIHAATVHLGHKTVFRRRQIFALAVAVVILYAVYEFSRMLQSHAHSQSLGFYLYLSFRKISVDIACRMSRGENHRTAISLLLARREIHRFATYATVALQYKTCHLGLEVYLAATLYYSVAHVLYHARQFVSADMRMGVRQDGCRGTMLAEYIQYLFRRSALLRPGIQFAVRVGTGSSLAKTVVGFPVHLLRL